MNGQLELRIIAQPCSEVYWGYFRRLVFGNSLAKHIKLSSFTVRNTLREIELQNDYCNGCGLTDHGCGMTLLANELQIRTIGLIPGITGHN